MLNHWQTLPDSDTSIMRTPSQLKKYLLDLLEEENTLKAELSVFLLANQFYSKRFSEIVNRLRLIKGIRVGVLYSMNKEHLSNDK